MDLDRAGAPATGCICAVPGSGLPTIERVGGEGTHIGTLGEKPLHASLKQWYHEPGDGIEVPVDGFVVDLVRGDLLIEVQTRGFSSMKRKVAALLAEGHRIRIVHPIAIDTWIVKVDERGAELSRRCSPKHGTEVDVFGELVSFPGLVADPALEVELVMVEIEELRHHTPGMSWRRNGWSVRERRLMEVHRTMLVRTVDDVRALVPCELPQPFSTSDLAEALGKPRRTAQQMAYCLRAIDVIAPVGKVGNAVQYRITA